MNAVDELLAGLHAAGADLVVTLPDSWLAPALTALDASPGVDLVRVAREEDGIGLCAGAWLGGRRALMLCQNAGLLVSVNALAALAHHHQIPVVVVAADRGGLEDGFFYQAYKGRVTCPVLDAIGTPWHRVDSPDGFRLLPDVFRQAELHRRPVVMLATRAALLGDGR
jgi:sulfopyruvate decarboxylase subunit alpha